MKMYTKSIIGIILNFTFAIPAFSQLPQRLLMQIESLNREKELRSPIQRKIDCQLLYSMKQDRGEPITELVQTLLLKVIKNAKGLVAVDIRVSGVSGTLLQTILKTGGEIVFQSPNQNTITASVPLQDLEQLATSNEVTFIYPADRAFTQKAGRESKKNSFPGPLMPFRYKRAGQRNSNNKDFQFGQQDNRPVELYGYETLKQKLNYLHATPVRAGIVYEPWHYKYSSAINYSTVMNRLLELELV